MFVHKFLVLCGCLVTLLAVLLGRARVSERRFGSQYEENSILFSRSVYTETEKTEKFKKCLQPSGFTQSLLPQPERCDGQEEQPAVSLSPTSCFLTAVPQEGKFSKESILYVP